MRKKIGYRKGMHISYQNIILTKLFMNKIYEAKQIKMEYFSIINKNNKYELMERFNFLIEYYRQIDNNSELRDILDIERERLINLTSRNEQLIYDISQLRVRWNGKILDPGFLYQVLNQYDQYLSLPLKDKFYCLYEIYIVLKAIKERGKLTPYEDIYEINLMNIKNIKSEMIGYCKNLPEFCAFEKNKIIWDIARIEKIQNPCDLQLIIRLLSDLKNSNLRHSNKLEAYLKGLDLCDELLGQGKINDMWECTQKSIEESKQFSKYQSVISSYIQISCYAYNAGKVDISNEYFDKFEESGISINHFAIWIQDYYWGLKQELKVS